MEQWLVRSANNILAGPYPRDQVILLIREGKLSVQDEVCRANHYWIYLHEHQEVLSQLGIHMPRSNRSEEEEITETQVEAIHDTVSAVAATAPARGEGIEESDGATMAVRTQVAPPASSGGTSRRPPQSASARPQRPTVPAPVHTTGQLERPSIWRGFAWLMVVVACLLVAAVLRLLRQSHG